MSDETLNETTETTETNETAEATQEVSIPKGLREKLERTEQRLKEAEARLRTYAFKEAGIELDSPEGKMLARLYEGPPDPEKIVEFAKEEFGYEPVRKTEEGPTDAQRQRVIEAAERMSVVAQAANPESGEPEDLDDQIRKAQEAGNWELVTQLELQKLMR